MIAASPLATTRLALEPLRVEHATEMAVALDDPALHTFIGGEPAGVDELRRRYTAQVRGVSADGRERWLNWVARRLGLHPTADMVDGEVRWLG